MKDEDVDGSDWLHFHRRQPEVFFLAFVLDHQTFILHPSAFILVFGPLDTQFSKE